MKYEYNENNNSELKRLTMKDVIIIKKERNSSFELLRIILMILIVFHHIFINTKSLIKINRYNYYKLICWQYIILKIISNYGQFGNNTFIMISGFFSISNTNFNLNKFLSILFEIYTYYYPSIYIGKKLSYIFTFIQFPNFSDYHNYFPLLSFNGNWFIQIYLILIVFTPFINTGLLSLNKRKYKLLVILIIIIYYSIAPIIKFFDFDPIIFSTNSFSRLLLPYIIGGYIKLYDLEYKKIWKAIGVFFFIVTILSEIISALLAYKYINYNYIKINVHFINSFSSLIGSIGIIYLFKNILIINKRINWISISVLGVYLIHGNKNISPYIYDIFFTINIKESYFILKYILKGIIIILLSILIDIIRRYSIGLLLKNLINEIILAGNRQK